MIMKIKHTLDIFVILFAISIIFLNPVFGQDKIAKVNWPQFRGVQASGVADAPDVPVKWDVESGLNIKWRAPIQGLGLSSPVVWGNKIFITTVVREDRVDESPSLKVGLYGNIDSEEENYNHLYQVICIEKDTGKTLWNQTAHKGIPKVKRHTKSSHANCSVATDGKHVVVFFGSEGLYCYNMDGNLIWKKELGFLNPGFFAVPSAQWGFASSPVIHNGRVITQCDVNGQSFIAAFNADTGEEVWRTNREESAGWSTPTVVNVNGKEQIVVNGWHRRGGYDFETGEEIWFMDGGGDIPVPTPIIAHGMSFYSSAHGPMAPLYAIKLDARGDISLKKGESTNKYVVWSYPRRGAYMPTPIIVGDYLYVANINGILTVYKAGTGEEVYQEQKLGGVRGAYTASPVSAGNKIYFSDEDGNIHVIQAGPIYKHLATNSMKESILASPAIAGKMIFIRTSKALYGIENMGKE